MLYLCELYYLFIIFRCGPKIRTIWEIYSYIIQFQY